MAIEKSLYQAPEGLEGLSVEPIFEIEMEPEVEITELEIAIGPEMLEDDGDFNANLAEYLDESALET